MFVVNIMLKFCWDRAGVDKIIIYPCVHIHIGAFQVSYVILSPRNFMACHYMRRPDDDKGGCKILSLSLGCYFKVIFVNLYPGVVWHETKQ